MKIIKQDWKRGYVRLIPEDGDDLWDLLTILDEGDLLRSSTERKIKLGGSEEKSRVVKKRVTLTIRANKIELNPGELRVLGEVVDGPDDIPRGSTHSFSLVPDTEFSIEKTWAGFQKDRLREATKARYAILAVLFDRSSALFLSIKGRGVETLLKLKGSVANKRFKSDSSSNFYKEIVQHTSDFFSRFKPQMIVFASPAFWQEYLKKELTDELSKHSVFTSISSVEKVAVHELIQRPELSKVMADNRTTRELGYVEEVMTALAHDKLVYGDKDVASAINNANVKALFLCESRIKRDRESGSFSATEKLLRLAETNGGVVHILTTEDAWSKVDPLGGLVGIKRW